MKDLKWYIIIIALGAGLICMGIGWYKEHQTTAAYQAKNQKVKEQILTGAKEISRVVKANGAQTLLLDITGNHTSSKNVDDTDIPDIVDTAAMALDIRTKQLKDVTVLVAQYRAENIQLKAQLDSNKRPYYTYNGNGLDLLFKPPYNPTENATADFLGRFGITVAKGNKSKWYSPWKSKDLMSVTSDSPYFIVDKVNYIGFDKDPLPFHAEIQSVASYNEFTGISGGPGVKVEIGRLNLSANYQYYDKFKAFTWGGTASFRLLGF